MTACRAQSSSTRASGFALFSVVFFVAIISLMSLAMTNSYLANTRATSLDVQRIKASQLLDSGVRFAALSLASPRAKVSGSAIPLARLVYASPDADVIVDVRNEAGFIDLLKADKELLSAALVASGASPADAPSLIESIQSLANPSAVSESYAPSYRRLRGLLADTSVDSQQLISVATLHNGRHGVHPDLASERVLTLVPKLSNAERRRILAKRSATATSLISSPIDSDFFTSSISAYYRVNVSLELQGRTYSQTQVIKMVNRIGRLYEVQARL